MAASINSPGPRQAQIGAILQGLSAAKEIYGLPGALRAQAEINAMTDAESEQSKAAQGKAKQIYANMLGNQTIDQATYDQSIADLPKRSQREIETSLKDDTPLMSMYKAKVSAQGQTDKFNSFNDTKKYMQENTIHEHVLNNLAHDKNLQGQLSTYQKINAAFANLAGANKVTGPQFHEFQQALRNATGLGSGGSADERAATYLHDMGINAANIKTLLTGTEQDINNPSFVQHLMQIGRTEQKNNLNNYNLRLKSLTGGHDYVYSNRPELKLALDDAIKGYGAQLQPINLPQSPSPSLQPIQHGQEQPGMASRLYSLILPSSQAQGGAPAPQQSPSMQDMAMQEIARRKSLQPGVR